MNTKIFFLVAILAVLLVTVFSEEAEQERPDVLYILNPGTIPKVLTDLSEVMTRGERNNLVCTAALCSNVCRALGYRFGRCNANRVCVCSNF